MEHRWITDIEEFRGITKEWDEAVYLSKEDVPFLLSDFILAWWKYYSGGLKLSIFIILENGKIAGGLPLFQSKNGVLEFIGGINANYTEFFSIKDSPLIWEFFFKALGRLEGWRCIRIRRMKKNKISMNELKSIAAGYHNVLAGIYPADYSYLIDISKAGPDYFQFLPKGLRYYIRRAEKEFSKLGRVSLESLRKAEELTSLCDKFIELSRSSFRRRNKRSAFEDKINCLFFRELIKRFYDAGCLDANALKLDERIIAIHFGYSIGNNLNYIFTAFDSDFAAFNPGHLLINRLLELGLKRKNKLFDFYTGAHLYKKQWSNSKEEIVSVEIRPNCLSGRMVMAIAGKVRRSLILNKARESLEHYPTLIERLRGIRALVKKYV